MKSPTFPMTTFAANTAMRDPRGETPRLAQVVLFRTWKAFCLEPYPFGLGYDACAIEALIEEKSAQARAEEVRPLAGHGGDRRSEETVQGDNVTLKVGGRGNSDPYLAARIARRTAPFTDV